MTHPLPEVEISSLPAELPDTVLVLDVREDDEWRAGHIANAVHIPLSQVPQRFPELPEGRQLLVVCKVGGRSAQATAFLQTQGRDAVNLIGGMLAWEHAHRPTVTDSGANPRVI